MPSSKESPLNRTRVGAGGRSGGSSAAGGSRSSGARASGSTAKAPKGVSAKNTGGASRATNEVTRVASGVSKRTGGALKGGKPATYGPKKPTAAQAQQAKKAASVYKGQLTKARNAAAKQAAASATSQQNAAVVRGVQSKLKSMGSTKRKVAGFTAVAGGALLASQYGRPKKNEQKGSTPTPMPSPSNSSGGLPPRSQWKAGMTATYMGKRVRFDGYKWVAMS